MIITGLITGAALGFILQRGRFCITGAFRDLWVSRSSFWLTAFLIAIAVQAIGVLALTLTGSIAPEAPQLSVVATAVGSLLFGIGIVLAGGCATGTYYRAGEGLIGSWVALIFYALFAAVMKFGPLGGFTEAARARTVADATIQETLGVSVWVPTIAFSALVAVLVVRQVRRSAARSAGKKSVRLPARRSGLGHYLADIPWNPWVGGVLLGLIATAAWVLSTAAGRNGGLGITTPSAKIITFLTTGDVTLVDWSVMLVLGILLGSFVAAKLSGEFRWRVPDANTILRSAGGGVTMGVGAALAGGCTIGNSLVETSLFSYQGWVSFAAIMLGTWGAACFFLVRPQKAAAKNRPAPVLSPAA